MLYEKLISRCDDCEPERDCDDCPVNEALKYYEEEEENDKEE